MDHSQTRYYWAKEWGMDYYLKPYTKITQNGLKS